MIYLDTHVVVWLYAGQTEKLSEKARSCMNENDIYVSPIVGLELQYLLEIKRITPKPQTIISVLSESIGLNICNKNFYQIVQCAQQYSWTRDPFDRIIVAQAGLNDNILVTKDQIILTHFKHAVW